MSHLDDNNTIAAIDDDSNVNVDNDITAALENNSLLHKKEDLTNVNLSTANDKVTEESSTTITNTSFRKKRTTMTRSPRCTA